MAEAALERLEPEFCNVHVVVALGRFNQLRTNQPGEIDDLCHFFGILNGPTETSPRQRPTPPLARGGLVTGLGPGPRNGNWDPGPGNRISSRSHCSPFPVPGSLSTSSTTP